MTLSLESIKSLREQTGAGMSDVKEALETVGGDHAQAIDYLRKKGKGAAQKKADRVAKEGLIGSYIHSNGKVAALVALACETDFVARNPKFQELAHDLAVHVAASRPDYLTVADVPADVIAHEREIAREQAAGKPDAVIEKIVDGKLEKFYTDHCLLRQLFVKDDSQTIQDLLDQATATIGEKTEIRSFVYFTL